VTALFQIKEELALAVKAALLLALVMTLGGCGGKTGTLQLDIVVSPVDDPFADAANVRFTIGDSSHVKVYPVTNGHFSFSFDTSPLASPGPVIVEALDSNSAVIAHGQTPVLVLQAVSQEVSVWVGRPGHVAGAATSLAAPLAEFGAAVLPGIGIVYAGGRSTDGTVLKDTSLFSVLTQSVIPPLTSTVAGIQPMTEARAGTVGAVTTGSNAVMVGGATSAGFGTSGSPTDDAESFTPFDAGAASGVGSYGTWTTLTGKIDPGRSYPEATVLSDGSILVSGGVDENGAAVDTAALMPTSGTITLNPTSTSMAAARFGHAVAATTFADGSSGALIIGGLAQGSSAPVAERLVSQAFAAYDVPGLDNRVNATATTLTTGVVLVVGGTINGVAVPTGVLIDTSNSPPTVTNLPAALSAPRAGHTATVLANNDVLVCGGSDDNGKPVGSCDLLDGATGGIKTTVQLANARTGHSALAVETGQVIIAGGFGADGLPLGSIEIYTQ